MEKYNYYEAMKADVTYYIRNNIDLADYTDKDEAQDQLNDEMWTADSVTGNGSGSYTFSTYEAEENLCHNLDLLAEACEEFGSDTDILKDGAEACDVTIRCYLLGQTIAEVLDEMQEAGETPEAWND